MGIQVKDIWRVPYPQDEAAAAARAAAITEPSPVYSVRCGSLGRVPQVWSHSLSPSYVADLHTHKSYFCMCTPCCYEPYVCKSFGSCYSRVCSLLVETAACFRQVQAAATRNYVCRLCMWAQAPSSTLPHTNHHQPKSKEKHADGVGGGHTQLYDLDEKVVAVCH